MLKAKYITPTTVVEISIELDVPPIHLYVPLKNHFDRCKEEGAYILFNTDNSDYDIVQEEEFAQKFKFNNYLRQGWLEVYERV